MLCWTMCTSSTIALYYDGLCTHYENILEKRTSTIAVHIKPTYYERDIVLLWFSSSQNSIEIFQQIYLFRASKELINSQQEDRERPQ